MRKALLFTTYTKLYSRHLFDPRKSCVAGVAKFVPNKERFFKDKENRPGGKYKKFTKFNPNNQNHVANAFVRSATKQSTTPIITKEDFSKEYANAMGFLNILTSYGLCETTMINTIYTKPEILSFDLTRSTFIIRELQNHGFSISGISSIIAEYPHILEYDPKDIRNTLESWKLKHFGERFLVKLFITYPLIFSLNDKEVAHRLDRINFIMQNKISRTTNLLLRNPKALVLNWDRIELTFQYLYYEMHCTEKEISRSGAISRSIAHIRLRHSFLDRCGIFIRPKLKETTGISPHSNPTLEQIVDTPDDIFARHVAKVSVGEFEVFKALMKYEEKLEEEDEEDDLEVATFNLESDFDEKSDD